MFLLTRVRHGRTMIYMTTNEDVEIPQITLGLRLHMAMRRAELSRSDMAQLMHVSAATITRWTSDKGDGPKRIYLERWAEVCRVPLAWLAGDLFVDPTDESQEVPHPRRRATDTRDEAAGDTHRFELDLPVCAAA